MGNLIDYFEYQLQACFWNVEGNQRTQRKLPLQNVTHFLTHFLNFTQIIQIGIKTTVRFLRSVSRTPLGFSTALQKQTSKHRKTLNRWLFPSSCISPGSQCFFSQPDRLEGCGLISFTQPTESDD